MMNLHPCLCPRSADAWIAQNKAWPTACVAADGSVVRPSVVLQRTGVYIWNCTGWLVYIGVQPDLEDSDAMFGYRLALVIRTTGDGEKKPSV